MCPGTAFWAQNINDRDNTDMCQSLCLDDEPPRSHHYTTVKHIINVCWQNDTNTSVIAVIYGAL